MSLGGKVGYAPDFHPGGPGLTPTQRNLPYMTTRKKCALYDRESHGVL